MGKRTWKIEIILEENVVKLNYGTDGNFSKVDCLGILDVIRNDLIKRADKQEKTEIARGV